MTFWEVDILGVDISGVDILGVDILGVDILGRTHVTGTSDYRFEYNSYLIKIPSHLDHESI